jgi:UDP-glucose 4-epimerase
VKKILILGGAGFIGSQLAEKFSKIGFVTIIDGLVDGTGGRVENICDIKNITFIDKCIENVSDLSEIVSKQDIIIDSMGWTSHLGAIRDPMLDLRLNLHSHLYLLDYLKYNLKKNSLVINLGSVGQYGSTILNLVEESTQMTPIDIQGINKVSTENYFRVYSNLYGINVISFRIPNCYGEHQPYEGEDIGLIGGFIRSALLNKKIEVYGHERKRNIIYVKDLVDIIYNVTLLTNNSFQSYNIPCHHIGIQEIALQISSLIDQCAVSFKKIPENIKKIDVNNYKVDFTKIDNKISSYEMHNLEQSLNSTIQYFRDKIK